MKSLNIRKKLVTLAVASVVSGGAMMAMTAPAHAMNVSQNNVGEVLLFPYYTVKNGFDTVFTVTNTTDRTAIFKVRFREALNSREVRDFNVILSPYDHWSAGVTSGATGGALVRTFDNTCTSPILPASATVSGAREVAFTNTLYSGSWTDGASEDIGRVQEGYFEVILMGLSRTEGDTVAVNAKHNSSGVPANCATVDTRFLPANLPAIQAVYDAPENVLKGHVVYINVANGTAIDAEPTAIENFQDTQQIIAAPGDLEPSLAHGDFAGFVNMINNGVVSQTVIATGSVDRVSALLRTTNVINEFATGAGAATSWVVTMPTKHHYTDYYEPAPAQGPTEANGNAFGGFSEWFYNTDIDGVAIDGKSCDDIQMGLVNREEKLVQDVDNTQFSPYNPSNETTELCYEANVIDFNSSSVFGTGTNRLAVSTSDVGTAGWATLTFTEAEAGTFGGLPVIGFAAIVRDASSASVNYGSSIEHTYSK